MVVMALYGATPVKLTEKYKDSSKCKACHYQIIEQWQQSWHSKSHYESDEYFRKTVDYLSRKSRRSKNAIEVSCAGCHNPRIEVTKTDINYEILVAMRLDKNSEVNKALTSDTLSEGINCVVCHNIDKIHNDRDPKYRGVERVSWLEQGTMVGPFKDAFSPYHKTAFRDHFNENVDTLCLVCHANDRSVSGLLFANMEKEYQKNSKKCVDCHMSPKIDGVASTLRLTNGHAKKRKVRKHLFRGAHAEVMWEGALDMDLKKVKNALVVTLKNDNPHNIPSGFGSRELIIDVEYKSVGTVIKRQTMSLTRHYTSKRKKPTIPHLAVTQTADMSVPAHGTKSVKFMIEKGADSVNVTLSYRLVNDQIHTLLDLKDPIWSKRMLINRQRMKF
jgi:hypothetical protein